MAASSSQLPSSNIPNGSSSDAADPILTISHIRSLLDNLLVHVPPKEEEKIDMMMYEMKETKDSWVISVDMPGLSKEHVTVVVKDNTLQVRGEGPKEQGADAAADVRRYGGTIDLPFKKAFKLGEIKAKMTNGVLKLVVPKDKTAVVNVDVE